MQSFIVVHPEKTSRDEYLATFFTKHTISPFDIIPVIGETSLGIEEIRQMQKSVFLTPVKGDKKAIILEEAQTLTIEAQNALLKVLEEPPAHVIFFLSTSSTDQLLPTILSRCNTIHLIEAQKELTQEEITALEQDLEFLLSVSVNNRLALAEKIASQKEIAPAWLSQTIRFLRNKLLEDVEHNTHLAPILTNLQEAYRLITTTNTNPRMVLEHCFLTP